MPGRTLRKKLKDSEPSLATAPNGYPLLRGGDRLAAVMLADLQFVIFRRETVILIAVGQLAGEGREVILAAVAAIGLVPGEHLAYRLDREVRQAGG